MLKFEEEDRHLVVHELAVALEAEHLIADPGRAPERPGDSGTYELAADDQYANVKYICSRCDKSYTANEHKWDHYELPLTPDELAADEAAAKTAACSRPRRDALARLLDLARPRVSLLTVVCEALCMELAEARGRAEHLGCCWDPQTCHYDDCHHCEGGLDADEDPSLHLHGARELAYRQALAQAKLLPALIMHMAQAHIHLDLSDANDEDLRRKTEPRLAELKDEITRAANRERWKRY